MRNQNEAYKIISYQRCEEKVQSLGYEIDNNGESFYIKGDDLFLGGFDTVYELEAALDGMSRERQKTKIELDKPEQGS